MAATESVKLFFFLAKLISPSGNHLIHKPRKSKPTQPTKKYTKYIYIYIYKVHTNPMLCSPLFRLLPPVAMFLLKPASNLILLLCRWLLSCCWWLPSCCWAGYMLYGLFMFRWFPIIEATVWRPLPPRPSKYL